MDKKMRVEMEIKAATFCCPSPLKAPIWEYITESGTRAIQKTPNALIAFSLISSSEVYRETMLPLNKTSTTIRTTVMIEIRITDTLV